jgi:colanic acid/amylovoran biosynthesis glycosyltransferase
MRILILTNSFPSASATFVYNHVRGLAGRGHDVTVLAKRSKGIPYPEDTPVFRLIHYSSEGKRRVLVFACKSALLFFLRHPLRFFRIIHQILIHHDWAVMQVFFAFKRLDGDVFDVTHAEFGPLGNMALALKTCGIRTGPICTSFRGADISSYIRRHPRAYALLAGRGEQFLPVCAAFIPRLRELGFPEHRIKVYHSAVDLDRFPLRCSERSRSSERILLIIIGRFVAKKGFHLAVEVVERLRNDGIDVELELIGDGPEREAVLDRAAEIGIADRVTAPGWLGRKEIYECLIRADVCLGTSITTDTGELEGIPNVLKEAMAVGVPVVAFDHSGVGELVQNGRTGFLVPEGNVETMARAVKQLVSDASPTKNIVTAARKLVEDEYGSAGQAIAVEGIYHLLISDDENKIRRKFANE